MYNNDYYNNYNANDTGMNYSFVAVQTYTEAMKDVAAILRSVFASITNIYK